VNGFCHGACVIDADCGPHDMCSAGLCEPDDRPHPSCLSNANCSTGQTCVDGFCRASCQTSADCCTCTTAIVCGPGGFCETPGEASPKCQLDAQCGTGMSCVDALCSS
jgi:hypothetical protein